MSTEALRAALEALEWASDLNQVAANYRPLHDAIASVRAALAQQAQPAEMSPEFTDTARAALAWVLWHHQGGSSKVGQAMRFALGMGDHERMSEYQVAEAKRWGALAQPSNDTWRDTVDDMLTVCGGVASDDPRESVNRLINWHVQVALDPAVSSDAQALIDQGKALAQPSTEPVAWVDDLDRPQPHCVTDLKYCSASQWDRGEHLKYVPLYAAPPSTERKPLTDEQIAAIGKRMLGVQFGNTDVDFARAIERAVKGQPSTERKPLHGYELAKVVADAGAPELNAISASAVLSLIRAIERAHGIGEKE